jgi:peroxiredoxin
MLFLSTLILASTCTFQEVTHDFTTSDEAVVWLKETLTAPRPKERMTTEQMDERTENVRAWIKRVYELNLDLGDEEYIVAIAHYAASGRGRGEASDMRSEACNRLLDYGVEHGGFPESAETWSNWIGRLTTFGVKPAIEKKDWPRAQLAAATLVEHSPDAYMSAQQLVKLLADQKEDVMPVRTALAIAIAESDEISFQEKGVLFTQLYGGIGEKGEAPFVAFSGPSLEGGELSVADFKGKVLLVDFWATWCGPCMREMPNVVDAWKKHKDQGFAVLGVSLDRPDSAEKIRKVMKKSGMEWPQIYDGDGWKTQPARLNGVRSIPATFLLDREGKVVATNLRGEALEKKIAEVLEEQPEPPAPTG